jgi:light-regulated signal transduction histidine kinase (bacteriophytochrome)
VAQAHPTRQVEALQRQLVQARQVLEDFTYSVSHDLRAPLRHVVSYLKILREDLPQPVDPAILSHLQTASDAAAQMGRQMDGLLELSRLGRQELQQGDVDLQLRWSSKPCSGLEPRPRGAASTGRSPGPATGCGATSRCWGGCFSCCWTTR